MNNRQPNKIIFEGFSDEEKEQAQDFVASSADLSIAIRILEEIIKYKEEIINSSYLSMQDDNQVKRYVQNKVEIQGMKVLLKDFSNLRSSSRD